MAAETVTFALPSGSKVTCSKEQAERMGAKPAATKKPAASKTSN